MNFAPIELHQRRSVDSIREKYGHSLSSHSFHSLYLWRDEMGLSLFIGDDFFVVKCLWKGANCYFFPCGGEETAARFIEAHIADPGFKLCYMRRRDADFLKLRYKGRFKVADDRGSSEYLYDRARETQLRGKLYSRLRYRLNSLERHHELSALELTAENSGEAKALVLKWGENHGPCSVTGLSDLDVSLEAVELRERLGLSGILAYVDGEAMALIVGGFLNHDMYDLCVTKVAGDYNGLEMFARRELFSRLPERCGTINAEEDLGIEGLRAHKLDMRPSSLVEVFEGRAING